MTRRGFSLIELVVATALAGTVMVAVLGAIARLAHRQEPAQAQEAQQAMLDELLALVEMDLLNAWTVKRTPDGFALRGHCLIDPERKTISHLPVTVQYRVQQAAKRGWLIRRQIPDDPSEQDQEGAEIVCAAVGRIAIAAKGESDSAAAIAGDWREVPSAVEVTVELAGPTKGAEKRLVKKVLHVR